MESVEGRDWLRVPPGRATHCTQLISTVSGVVPLGPWLTGCFASCAAPQRSVWQWVSGSGFLWVALGPRADVDAQTARVRAGGAVWTSPIYSANLADARPAMPFVRFGNGRRAGGARVGPEPLTFLRTWPSFSTGRSAQRSGQNLSLASAARGVWARVCAAAPHRRPSALGTLGPAWAPGGGVPGGSERPWS